MVLLKSVLKSAQRFPVLRKRLKPGKRASAWAAWKVEFNLVGAPAMKRLNSRYRGKDYATDVLSFPAPEVFREQGLLGELVICGPVLERQAREQNHSPKRELEVLLVHGVLHLLGFDHELGKKQAAEMARWEDKLLSSPGSGSTTPAKQRKQSGPQAAKTTAPRKKSERKAGLISRSTG